MHLHNDKQRKSPQAPIAQTKFCVLYLKEQRECCTPWFYTEARARAALGIMLKRYGPNSAIIYRD